MANEMNSEDPKAVVVEFRVSMYCNACERKVAKAISKFKGVQTFTTEMYKHKAVVTGRMDAQKLLKKLKKKTGKRVEIVENKKKEEKTAKDDQFYNINNGGNNAEPAAAAQGVPQPLIAWPPFFDYCKEREVLMMFSDENPNACSIL